MKWPYSLGVVVFACATTGFSGEIELTGLIDIEGCRMACFRLLPQHLEITLHAGESAQGIALQDLDAKAGWARFRAQNGTTKIWLGSFCAQIPARVSAAESDPVTTEGERVRMLNGQAGFLAWDLARGQAALADK